MPTTYYHHTSYLNEDGTERHEFSPAADALQLGEYERRIITSLLTRQLHEYHEKVTGPRDRIGSDLTHNTRDAAVGVWQVLASVNREAAERFKETYSLPSRWQNGPVVDPQGFLCQGIYSERVDPPVSPRAYVSPAVKFPLRQLTEHERRIERADGLRRKLALLDPEEATL